MESADTTGPSRSATAWFAVVIFAYSYKAVLCGLFGHVLGFDVLCTTMIRGISINHWIETLVYCPLLWLSLHLVNRDVFGPPPSLPSTARGHARRRLIGEFAVAIVLYGTGIHVANVIEINAREEQGVTDGGLYDLIYFLDEGLSHWLQFIPLFFVIGWFVVWDRPGRTFHSSIAVVFGLAHGVERANGIIEGAKWFVGPPTVLWLGACVAIRFRRQGSGARHEFFVRYAVTFCLVHPIALALYRIRYGSFAQPSSLGDSGLAELVTVAAAVIIVGGLIAAYGGQRSRTAELGLTTS